MPDVYRHRLGRNSSKEIEKIRSDELDATPMRMSDDLGVATAEAIKFHLEQARIRSTFGVFRAYYGGAQQNE